MKNREYASKIKDTQIIELIGRNRLGSDILRDGLDVAVPARDRGIDLIAYADLSASVKTFVARPIQMKASSEASFSIDRNYKKLASLIIAYIWHVHDPNKTVTYALTYREAFANREKMLGSSKRKLGIVEAGKIFHKQAEPQVAQIVRAVQGHRRKMVGESHWYSLQAQIWAEEMTKAISCD